MSKKHHIGERDWNRQPLFGPRRRRAPYRLLLVLLLALAGLALFLFPEAVRALLAPLLPPAP